ncbi:MAG: glycosyltransferase [Lentisphaerae bacterium]|nr:glycosyltransferase [Lentisphaerota bacterium]
MGDVLFSVVMPVLNAMPYFERALGSVMSQAGGDTEIIVVDGGSTDGTVELLRTVERNNECSDASVQCSDDYCSQRNDCNYEGKKGSLTKKSASGRGVECLNALMPERLSVEKDLAANGAREKRGECQEVLNTEYCTLNTIQRSVRTLRWVSERDGGQSEALNKGFAMARGRYLFWLNGDDMLLPGALEKIRGYLKEHPECEWLAGNMVIIDEKGVVRKCLRGSNWFDYIYRHAPVRVYGPSSVFSRELYLRSRGFDNTLHYCMDSDLWQQFRAMGVRYVRLHEYIWGFRNHEASKTNSGVATTEEVQAQERKRMHKQNGLQVRRWNTTLSRARRCLDGTYLMALADTLRMRGQRV